MEIHADADADARIDHRVSTSPRTEDSHVTEDGDTMPVRVLHAYGCACGEDWG